MTQAQKMFEAIMRTKGHADFTMHKGKYINPGLAVRWNYFLLGWEMAQVSK